MGIPRDVSMFCSSLRVQICETPAIAHEISMCGKKMRFSESLVRMNRTDLIG